MKLKRTLKVRMGLKPGGTGLSADATLVIAQQAAREIKKRQAAFPKWWSRFAGYPSWLSSGVLGFPPLYTVTHPRFQFTPYIEETYVPDEEGEQR